MKYQWLPFKTFTPDEFEQAIAEFSRDFGSQYTLTFCWVLMKIELIPSDKILSIIPLLKVLNDQIDDRVLEYRLNEMVLQGYQCIGVYDETKLVAICGMWIITKYYVGKHIEPDNVVVLPEYRSKGLGKKIMAWIYEYGRSQGCIASELNCYIPNKSGQKFWESEGYTAIGYHYQKII